LIDNFAPGTLARLGINYAELRSQRPELVTCSISLFGGFETAGELARRGGLAIIAEAESSLASMQPTVDGGAPMRFGTPIGDTCAGLSAYAAIVTALLAKSTTGLGRHLDISMVKALLAHNTAAVAAAQLTEHREVQQRMAGWGYFPSRDGYVAIGVNSDALFARLALAIGEEWMTTDARYAEFAARDANADDVDAIVSQWTSVRGRSVVVETLTAARVPCGLVANLADILESDQSTTLGLFETVDDTLGGSIRTPAAPHEYRRGGRLAIPRLDEHGAEILSETLGVGSAEYDGLKAAGAFG
jgi:formyl-CoA transferase